MLQRFVLVLAIVAAMLGVPSGIALAGENHDGHDMTDMTTKKSDSGKKNNDSTKQSHMGGNAETVPGARQVLVTGDAYTFSPRTITIGPGEDVTVVLTASDIGHDFMVKGVGHVVSAKRGKTAEGGLRIDEPGTYKLWCAVKGHRAAGMTGTIVVQ